MVTLTQRVVPVVAAAFVALTLAVPVHAQRKTNILTADEIEHAKLVASNAYEVVEMLRPRWLTSRELARLPGSASDPLKGVSVRIYLNDHNAGDVDYLRTIPAEQILEMRWYGQNEAASRFGPTSGDAAIEITLKK
jgi:hypothetical protein